MASLSATNNVGLSVLIAAWAFVLVSAATFQFLRSRRRETPQPRSILVCGVAAVFAGLLLAGLVTLTGYSLSDFAVVQAELQKKVRVVDESGKPIAGASVWPWGVRAAQQRGSSRQGEETKRTTDKDGRATVSFPRYADPTEKLRTVSLTCPVYHPEYVESIYNEIPVTEEVLEDEATIVLQQGARVELAAYVGDRPLPMDRVHALWSSSWSDYKYTKLTPGGLLQLPPLPAGTELVRLVYFPEDGPAMFSRVEAIQLIDGERRELRLQMEPAVRVEGRLDDSVPRPVKNGRVVAVAHMENEETNRLHWKAWTPVAEDGSFSLEALPGGVLQVIALCDGFMAQSGEPPGFATKKDRERGIERLWPQVFPLNTRTNQITLKMTPTANCLIRVLGPGDRPVAGANCAFSPNVWFWGSGGGGQFYCYPLRRTEDLLRNPKLSQEQLATAALPVSWPFHAVTDAEGIALVKGLPPQELSFSVWHDDLELPLDESDWRDASADLKVGEPNEVTVTMQFKGTKSLRETTADVMDWLGGVFGSDF